MAKTPCEDLLLLTAFSLLLINSIDVDILHFLFGSDDIYHLVYKVCVLYKCQMLFIANVALADGCEEFN